MQARTLIDALNVAHWCGKQPSLRLPLGLMSQLLADGHEALMIFDASTRHRLATDDRAVYEQLLQQPGCALEAPSGRSADSLLLKQARATGAGIVSRDHYAEHRRRYRKLIDDANRLHPGWVRDGHLCVPSLALDTTLATTVEAAWHQLRQTLQHASSRGTLAPLARLPATALAA